MKSKKKKSNNENFILRVLRLGLPYSMVLSATLIGTYVVSPLFVDIFNQANLVGKISLSLVPLLFYSGVLLTLHTINLREGIY